MPSRSGSPKLSYIHPRQITAEWQGRAQSSDPSPTSPQGPIQNELEHIGHPGDQLWEYIAGGAGYGDPLERDPATVLTADGAAVDEVKTKERRKAPVARTQRMQSSLP